MTKRIIICCDGTWNEPEAIVNNRQVPTNVLKLVRAVNPRDEANGIDQVIYYARDMGTGIFGKFGKYVRGATGVGISRNVRDAYRFLALNYVEGDEVFGFGFSRGAYTIRCLSGMLDAIGLLNKNDLDRFPDAYRYYRTPPEKRPSCKYHLPLTTLPRVQPKIKFLGVWDTVGAFGTPTPWLGRLSKKLWVGFHDATLAQPVENAYQALAVDERRGPFMPAIWDRRTGQKNVQQVWFAGSHSNIGGGYQDSGLSDIAFTWLINRAVQHGLAVDSGYMSDRSKVAPQTDGLLVASFSSTYKLLKKLRVAPYPRPIGHYLNMGEMVHESVVKRLLSSHSSYHPTNLIPAGQDPGAVLDQKSPRATIRVHGLAVPIFRERRSLRQAVAAAPATLTLADNVSVPCRVSNYSDAGGVMLAVDEPLEPGTEGVLDYGRIGRHKIQVVWSRENNIGVKFAA